MTVALMSPELEAYSETFVRAHKEYLSAKVLHYYGRREGLQLEGATDLWKRPSTNIFQKLNHLFFKPSPRLWYAPILESFQREGVGVILVEFGNYAYMHLDVLQASGLPVVVHFHGFDAHVGAVVAQCEQYQGVFKMAHRVVAVSRYMEQELLALGCPQEKLVVSPCGPHEGFKTIQSHFKKPQFVSVGRFTDKKAPHLSLVAFQQVIKVYPESTFCMVGTGPLLDSCKALVKALGLEASVFFLGVMDRQDIMDLFSDSLAFVQHSVRAANGDCEGTPVAVLEAGLAGLPVVGTRHAGILDVVEHEETGLLCDEFDVETMAKHMMQLLEDGAYAKGLGASAKKHIHQHFSMVRHIGILEETLEKAFYRL